MTSQFLLASAGRSVVGKTYAVGKHYGMKILCDIIMVTRYDIFVLLTH